MKYEINQENRPVSNKTNISFQIELCVSNIETMKTFWISEKWKFLCYVFIYVSLLSIQQNTRIINLI